MPDFSTYIDIDPDEYVSSCSNSEIGELIDSLIEEGHLSEASSKNEPKNKNVLDLEWDEVCEKIRKSRLRLTSEDENLIKEFSNKL
jgi:hypothetical protein